MDCDCYLSYWEGALTMSPHPVDEQLFRDLGPLALIIEERTICMAADPAGHVASPISQSRNAGLSLQYKWHIDEQPWARFMRHEETVNLDGDTITWVVPPDHTLAWPCLQCPSDSTLDLPAIAQRELHIRGRSAYLVDGEEGLKDILRDVPDKVRGLLGGAPWTHIIELIQDEKEFVPWT